MIRSGEGCIRTGQEQFLSPYLFSAATGTRDYHRKRMFEGHCCRRGHLIHCFKTIVLISHMSLKVIASAELPVYIYYKATFCKMVTLIEAFLHIFLLLLFLHLLFLHLLFLLLFLHLLLRLLLFPLKTPLSGTYSVDTVRRRRRRSRRMRRRRRRRIVGVQWGYRGGTTRVRYYPYSPLPKGGQKMD